MADNPEAYAAFNTIRTILSSLEEADRAVVLRWLVAAPIEKYKELLAGSISAKGQLDLEKRQDWPTYRFLCGWNECLSHARLCLGKVPELHEPPPPKEPPK